MAKCEKKLVRESEKSWRITLEATKLKIDLKLSTNMCRLSSQTGRVFPFLIAEKCSNSKLVLEFQNSNYLRNKILLKYKNSAACNAQINEHGK